MEIEIRTELGRIKGGVSARVPRIGLVGHGADSEAALASLRLAVRSWAVGLSNIGLLEDALDRRGIRWTNRKQDIEVLLKGIAP